MRTNIVLDDTLVNEAFRYAKNIRTKKALIEQALQEFVDHHKMKDLRELRGAIRFADDYDYKQMRQDS